MSNEYTSLRFEEFLLKECDLGEEDREGRAKIGVHFVQLVHLKGEHLATS